MSTTHGIAVSQANRRAAFAVAAGQLAAAIFALALTCGAARAAGVTGSVTKAGMATQSQKLEAMSFGGTVSYGNYFAMPDQGPYGIVIDVRRPGDSKTATARFQYWHPR